MNKTCKKCEKSKPVSSFVISKECKDGRAGTCRECRNKYSTMWKLNNAKRISEARRKQYAETAGRDVKAREQRRLERYPLRVQCQRLRYGMIERSRLRGLPFDSSALTVGYLMDRLERNPACECCRKRLAIGGVKHGKPDDASPSIDRIHPERGYTVENVAILCWRCNNLKRDATPMELKIVTDWMLMVLGDQI